MINELYRVLGNQKIYVVAHSPQETPTAVILLVHGLGEHVRRYDLQFTYFVQKGYAVLAADLLGHGRSEGTRGLWNSVQDLYQVIDILMEYGNTIYASIPKILYGHSMGANLAAGYVLQNNHKIKGLILTGAAIRTSKDLPEKIVDRLLKAPSFIKNITFPNGLDLKYLSLDASIVKSYKVDPLVHNQVSLGAGATILKNAFDILSNTKNISVPTLILHGENDRITYPSGSIALHEKWKNSIYHSWPGMVHEIHNEPKKVLVWEYILDWIERIKNE